MLGYSSGLQLRDCAYLGLVLEPFDFAQPQWGDVQFSAIFPDPCGRCMSPSEAALDRHFVSPVAASSALRLLIPSFADHTLCMGRTS